MPDHDQALVDAVRQVRDAARHHPAGEAVALKAAGQTLLSRVDGLQWRTWPVDEPLDRTLDAQARDFAETARELSMVQADGDAVVYRMLLDLIRELGFDADLNVPF